MASRFDDVTVTGTLKANQTAISQQTRATILVKESVARFPVLLTSLRIWDAIQSPLTGTPGTDDLGIIGTTFGSVAPTVTAGDCKAATVTRYARFLVPIPECYVAGDTLQIIISAGMVTNAADTSCTLDLVAYRMDKDGAIGSDICATSAININQAAPSVADREFTITAATVSPGDVLDCRIVIAAVDGATGTAVTPTIGSIDLACDIRG